MKNVDLYVRVSTDEQADKGYSQRDQEERLRRYCEINSFNVRRVIYDDHSAKTFIRPGWTRLLSDYKKRKNNPDFILFTKWDRFSRNAGDAYQMISTLRKLFVEPQAVEQPLDLSIPENKMMMAFYLAAPEVENDRRALNTFYGMRRAKKEGRWMATAPLGYKNKTSESGKKQIVVDETKGALMIWAFNEIAKGILAADQVRKEMNKKGVKCSSSNFWRAIRNPVYYGKIFIPKHKDEDADLVQGEHEPLITEALFFQVQDVLDGNKRAECPNTKVDSGINFPLRGFLACPKCGRSVTGSGSRGKYARYFYYHCTAACGFRQRAEHTNRLFELELKKYVPHNAIAELSQAIIADAYSREISNRKNSIKQVMAEIEKQNSKILKARELLLSDAIESDDYKSIKDECDKKIVVLESQLKENETTLTEKKLKQMTERTFKTLTNIHLMYENGTVTEKRKIISSIFSEKIVFDGEKYRTPKLNRAAAYIYHFNYNLHIEKNRKSEDEFNLSGEVAPKGIEPLPKVPETFVLSIKLRSLLLQRLQR